MGKIHSNEILTRKQIVFTGFIDDTNHSVLARKLVFENWIEFSQLERRGIVVVSYTNGEVTAQ